MRYRELAEAAWAWVLGQVRDDDGPWLPEVVRDDPPRPAGDRDSLYAGIAGLAPVLVELGRHRPLTGAETALANGVVDRLGRAVADRVEASLYDGLAGDVTALRLLAPGRERAALDRLAELRTPAGWETTLEAVPGSRAPLTDIVTGTAGVVLAAAWAAAADERRGPFLTENAVKGPPPNQAGGDSAATAVMTTGCEALLRVAEPAEGGLDWRMWPGYRSSSPNFSHGTAGVASALVIAGQALGREDFVAAARQGAEHLVRIASLDDGGFVVEHTIPRSQREVEPVTYNWCHGPAGTSQLFAALARAGIERVGEHDVGELRRRCLHSVLTSGLPQRLRPGFWDNDGRCCGTAGVGDILLDAYQDTAFADTADEALLDGVRTMADALVERAIVDEAGARWRFVEYRQDPPLLPPRTTWMQGAAGIAAFLLRYARFLEEGPTAAVVDRPDQWWAVPERLCVSRADGAGTGRDG